jgi:hypothetical protein
VLQRFAATDATELIETPKEIINMKQSYRTIYFIIAIALISSLALGACTGTSEKKMYTIGVVNLSASFDRSSRGSKLE